MAMQKLSDVKNYATYQKNVKLDLDKVPSSGVPYVYFEKFTFDNKKVGPLLLVGAPPKLVEEVKASGGTGLTKGKVATSDEDELVFDGGGLEKIEAAAKALGVKKEIVSWKEAKAAKPALPGGPKPGAHRPLPVPPVVKKAAPVAKSGSGASSGGAAPPPPPPPGGGTPPDDHVPSDPPPPRPPRKVQAAPVQPKYRTKEMEEIYKERERDVAPGDVSTTDIGGVDVEVHQKRWGGKNVDGKVVVGPMDDNIDKVQYLKGEARERHRMDAEATTDGTGAANVKLKVRGAVPDKDEKPYLAPGDAAQGVEQKVKNQFVMDQDGKVYGGSTERSVDRAKDGDGKRVSADVLHHSSLLAGEAVAAAGEILTNEDGVVKELTNLSGHYKPGEDETKQAIDGLREMGVNTANVKLTLQDKEGSTKGMVEEFEKGGSADQFKKRHAVVDELSGKAFATKENPLGHQSPGAALFEKQKALANAQLKADEEKRALEADLHQKRDEELAAVRQAAAERKAAGDSPSEVDEELAEKTAAIRAEAAAALAERREVTATEAAEIEARKQHAMDVIEDMRDKGRAESVGQLPLDVAKVSARKTADVLLRKEEVDGIKGHRDGAVNEAKDVRDAGLHVAEKAAIEKERVSEKEAAQAAAKTALGDDARAQLKDEFSRKSADLGNKMSRGEEDEREKASAEYAEARIEHDEKMAATQVSSAEKKEIKARREAAIKEADEKAARALEAVEISAEEEERIKAEASEAIRKANDEAQQALANVERNPAQKKLVKEVREEIISLSETLAADVKGVSEKRYADLRALKNGFRQKTAAIKAVMEKERDVTGLLKDLNLLETQLPLDAAKVNDAADARIASLRADAKKAVEAERARLAGFEDLVPTIQAPQVSAARPLAPETGDQLGDAYYGVADLSLDPAETAQAPVLEGGQLGDAYYGVQDVAPLQAQHAPTLASSDDELNDAYFGVETEEK